MVCAADDKSAWSQPTTILTQVGPPVCGGNFRDEGGVSNYPNNSDSTVTICPSVFGGDPVNVSFTSFNTEATFDALLKMRDPYSVARQRGVELTKVFNG